MKQTSKVKQHLLYINGEWVGENLEELNVVNPATGQIVGSVPIGWGKRSKRGDRRCL